MTDSVDRSAEQDATQASGPADQHPLDDVAAPADSAGAVPGDTAESSPDDEPGLIEQVSWLENLVNERTQDLQRVQAEYMNYKRRVDRDRTLARQGGIEAVLRDLMPVFDSILAAQAHDDLTGGFKLTADELIKVTKSYGFESFGAVGDEFDPHLHEALMQVVDPDVETMQIGEVMQVGFKANDLVLRPARVVVAVPADE